MVDGVRRQVQRLEHQIEKLILLARLERGDFTASREPFELGPAIQLAMATSQADARERGIALTVTPPPDGLLARGDADDFRSALFEVVENAVKFTHNGGRVDVGVETAGDEVVVRVVDSGIGIDPRDQQAIFAPFKQLEDSLTRRHAGAGLGLGLARRMLEAVGGSITVASVPGHGSVFSLHIPREPQPREQQPRDRQAAPTSPEAGFKAVSAATEAVSA
jgi:two-component system cell cycle sensor histidine kinase PleC